MGTAKDPDDIFEVIDVRIAKNKNDTWINKMFGDITKASAAKQLTVGGVIGWCSGFVFTKVGKTAASAIAGGLVIFQVAQHQGYIRVNWTRVNRDIEKAKKELEKHTKNRLPRIVEEGQQFLQDNVFLATGFAGGFLIGLASS